MRPRHSRHPHPVMRPLALLLAGLLLLGCTRHVPRAPVDVRRFSIDQAALAGPLQMDGLTLRSMVLTPAVWPLESSYKRLLNGDFIGVFEAFDLRFRSTRIPEGALAEFYAADLLPVYLHVENASARAAAFTPALLRVAFAGDALLFPVDADTLPQTVSRIDWTRTAALTAALLLIVVLVAAGGDDNSDSLHLSLDVGDATLRGASMHRDATGYGRESRSMPSIRPDHGLLRAQVLQPGERREGIVFFAIRQPPALDWQSARLVGP